MKLQALVEGGEDLEVACATAVALANQLQVKIVFEFNGIGLTAEPGNAPMDLVERWRSAYRVRMEHPLNGFKKTASVE